MPMPTSQRDYMNYPFTRATDVIGASMATPVHLLKEHQQAKNPAEIMI